MKSHITLAATALALLSLSGCASQSQIDEQNKQLANLNLSLQQIQQNQLKSMEYQKAQIAYQQQQVSHELNDVMAVQMAAQPRKSK